MVLSTGFRFRGMAEDSPWPGAAGSVGSAVSSRDREITSTASLPRVPEVTARSAIGRGRSGLGKMALGEHDRVQPAQSLPGAEFQFLEAAGALAHIHHGCRDFADPHLFGVSITGAFEGPTQIMAIEGAWRIGVGGNPHGHTEGGGGQAREIADLGQEVRPLGMDGPWSTGPAISMVPSVDIVTCSATVFTSRCDDWSVRQAEPVPTRFESMTTSSTPASIPNWRALAQTRSKTFRPQGPAQ